MVNNHIGGTRYEEEEDGKGCHGQRQIRHTVIIGLEVLSYRGCCQQQKSRGRVLHCKIRQGRFEIDRIVCKARRGDEVVDEKCKSKGHDPHMRGLGRTLYSMACSCILSIYSKCWNHLNQI